MSRFSSVGSGSGSRFTPTLPGNTEFSGAYNSQEQRSTANVESNVNDQVKRAKDTLVKDITSPFLTDSERKDLQRIASGQLEKEGNFSKFLKILDTPGALVRATVADAFGGDTKMGKEIDRTDYWNIFKGDTEAVKASLGEDLVGEDGRISGSKLIELGGWELAKDDGSETGERVARGIAAFGLDVILDPLSYVGWGTLGIGKKQALTAVELFADDAARVSGEVITREVVEAGADAAIKGIANPLSQRIAKGTVKRFDDAVEELTQSKMDEIFQAASKDGGKHIASEGDRLAAEAFVAEQADELFKVAAREAADEVKSGIGKLVVDKQFKTLRKEFPELIAAGAPNYAIGGLSITTPFGRKSLDLAINTGIATNAPLKKAATAFFRKTIPHEIRTAVGDIAKRVDTFRPYQALVSRGLGAKVSRAQGFRDAKSLATGVKHQHHTIRASIEILKELAGGSQVDEVVLGGATTEQYAMSALSHALDGGGAESINLIENASLREGVQDTYTLLRGSLDMFIELANDAGMDIAHRPDYFPAVATADFMKIVGGFNSKGVEIAIDEAPAELRQGLELIAEYSGASGRLKGQGGKLTSGTNVPFKKERRFGQSVSFPFDGQEVALMPRESLGDLLEAAGSEVSIPKATLNKKMWDALNYVVESQGGKLDPSLKVFNENVEDVIDIYTNAMVDALEVQWFVNGLKAEGLIKNAPGEVNIQRVLVSLDRAMNKRTKDGVSSVAEAVQATRQQLGARAADPRAGSFKLDMIDVGDIGDGTKVAVPSILTESKEGRAALRKVRAATKRAAARKQATQDAINIQKGKLIAQGINPELAAEMASVSAAPELLRLKNELRVAAVDQWSILQDAVDLTSEGLSKPNLDAVTATRRELSKIVKGEQKLVRQAENTWRTSLGVGKRRTVTTDLTKTLPNGSTPLAVLADQIETALGKKSLSREAISAMPETSRKILQEAQGDVGKLLDSLDNGAFDLAFREAEKARYLKALEEEGLADGLEGLSVDLFFGETMWDRLGSLSEPGWARTNIASLESRLDTARRATRALTRGTADRQSQITLAAMRSGDMAALEGRQALVRRLFSDGGIDGVELTFNKGKILAKIAGQDDVPAASFQKVMSWIRENVPETKGMSRTQAYEVAAELHGAKALKDLPEDVGLYFGRVGPILPPEPKALLALRQSVASKAIERNAATAAIRTGKAEARKVDAFQSAWRRVSTALEKAVDGKTPHNIQQVWRDSQKAIRGHVSYDDYARTNDLVEQFDLLRKKIVPETRIRQNAILDEQLLHPDVEEALSSLRSTIAETERMADEMVGAEAEAQLAVVDAFTRNWARHASTKGIGADLTDMDGMRQWATEEDLVELAALKEQAQATGKIMADLAQEVEDEILAKHIAEAARGFGFDKNWQLTESMVERAEQEGYVAMSGFGVGLQGVADPDVAIILENMLTTMKGLRTPDGVRLLTENSRSALQWWKAAATVARPTFVPRNLFTGSTSNQIIGVGARDYAIVGKNALLFRKALRSSKTLEEALAAIPNPRTRLAFKHAFEEGVLTTAFSSDLEHLALDTGKGLSAQTFNPASSEFALFQLGGRFMESSEDFLRMSAFVRHFDAGDLADVSAAALARRKSTAKMAAGLANAVHFDYGDLTPLEAKVKQLVPFFVWSRRNIPLYMRVAVERPGMINRYTHFMTEMDQSFPDTELDILPDNKYATGMQVETDIMLGAGTDFQSRLIFDPDLPLTDLARVMDLNPLSAQSWGKAIGGLLGPQITTPFDLMDSAEYSDVNAPVGLHQVLRGLNAIGLWDNTSDEGDPQVSYNTRRLMETVVPFYDETAGTLFPTDPRRKANLGITEDGGFGERARAVGLRGARAFGIGVQSPSSSNAAVYDAKTIIDDIISDAKIQGRLAPDE